MTDVHNLGMKQRKKSIMNSESNYVFRDVSMVRSIQNRQKKIAYCTDVDEFSNQIGSKYV